MTGGTHAAIGMAVGLAVGLHVGQPVGAALLLGGAGALAGLLPDIDHPKSTIGRRLWLISRPLDLLIDHRGITHTALLAVLLALLCWRFLPYPLALALAGGYAAHLAADMLTKTGIPLLWPLYRSRVRLIGVTTGGWFDRGLALAAIMISLEIVRQL